MKKTTNNTTKQPPPGEGRLEQGEIYHAPPPPSRGRIIGLDCHPDTFTAAVFRGTTPHDAVKLATRPDMSLQRLLDWAARECTKDDLFLMEASGNSFEIHRRLLALGLRALVLESCHVGKHAKTYADNDKMAAARIVLVYLQGNAPCVWVPDARTCERRELLHAYNKAVEDRTAAINSLKSYLNQFAIRTGRQTLEGEKAEKWSSTAIRPRRSRRTKASVSSSPSSPPCWARTFGAKCHCHRALMTAWITYANI